MPALQERWAGCVLWQGSPGAGRNPPPFTVELPELQGELRGDLQVVPGVGEWPEPLASGWEWPLTLHLTKGSGPCRAEWGGVWSPWNSAGAREQQETLDPKYPLQWVWGL